MNKESQHEGWLIKSPPTKRIWRARWRRRWFTLKQGEIPEQFCLEYYTDRNCRKLKGVIDLDQCEQVDCGLRLENRKQKFQYMFDIKTPKRTYYLAADTEADMRDWVNCICQVCHLHDTKQSNELLQDETHGQPVAHGNSTNNTTTTTLSSSTGPSVVSSNSLGSGPQSYNNELLRRPVAGVVDQQPTAADTAPVQNSENVYVNTDYTNRETLLCELVFERQPLVAADASNAAPQPQTPTAKAKSAPTQTTTPSAQQLPTSPGAALYLNSPVFEAHNESWAAARLAVNTNGVVRKIPENLVLNNTPLPETQQHSVQPSPALSTASGPYIPISECFSGSPKFSLEGNNPSTPLNNLDPKFYDTPRSHNNIGLNLTNDQSYSPKITNCSLQQIASKMRSHRSDSDSESVFTDDEWAHPRPLRENVDRSTRPSDSSIENESFVLTYTQRFSKIPDDVGKEQKTPTECEHNGKPTKDPLDKLAKVLKNKNNLILDFKEHEKIPRDLPQLSDTENTSPAIGPRDSTSVVEESYDIPRSHNLPYYNVGQLFEKVTSPETNPIAASTPNLMAGASDVGVASPGNVHTLSRPHCYTNAAPSKIEGNVFRYDFMEQSELPPVNRSLKPKVNLEDKPPEEVPAKPPMASKALATTPPISAQVMDTLVSKLMASNMQSPVAGDLAAVMKPPSVDRNLKPDAYKLGKVTLAAVARRSMGLSSSMMPFNDTEGYMTEAHTLPRQPRVYKYAAAGSPYAAPGAGLFIQHQRTASAAAAVPLPQTPTLLQLQPKNEHKLQYFDLDVANPPTIKRQSMSVGNLNAPGTSRLGPAADAVARSPAKSSVVYNSVDFVKTEAFKRIREERKKESECISSGK